MSLPSAVTVCDMFPLDLAEIAESELFQGVDVSDRDSTTMRETLLSSIADRRRVGNQPIIIDRHLSASFEAKRKQCLSLLADLETLVTSQETKQLFEGLEDEAKLLSLPSNLQEAREMCEFGKPWLLIAGTTSAGKSTFVNLLLGEDLLPVAHELTTSVICVIRYADSKPHKLALLYRGQEEPSLQLDLNDKQHYEQFKDFVTRKKDSDYESDDENEQGAEEISISRTRVEIFLDIEFLKCFTLVDSPGVSDAMQPLRALTKQFQENNHVCGFLYILNANLASDEAAQVGDLVNERLNATDAPLSLKNFSNTLFIANKWDELVDDQEEEVTDNYEDEIYMHLRRKVKHLQRYQILPMHARLCRLVRRAGEVHPFMQRLIDRLQDILPKGMDDLLARAIETPLRQIYKNRASTKLIVQQLQSPTAVIPGKHWLNELKEKIESAFRADGALGIATTELQRRISELVTKLTTTRWLVDDDGVKAAFNNRKAFKTYKKYRQFRTVDDAESTRIVLEGLCRAVHKAVTDAKIYEWANDQLKLNSELIDNVLGIRAELSDETLRILPMDLADRQAEMEDELDMRKNRILGATAGSIGLGGVAVVSSIGLATGLLGLAVAAAVGAAVGIAVASVVATRAFQYSSWCKKMIQLYKTVAKSSENSLIELVKNVLLSNNCQLARVLLNIAPALRSKVESEALKLDLLYSVAESLRKSSKAHHIEKWLVSLNRWINKACHCVLSLATFEYTAFDITNVQRTGGGAFGEVSQVIVHKHEKRALKILKDPISETTAQSLLGELSNCRKLQGSTLGVSNIVQFFGAVCLPDDCRSETKRLGLVFEWCDGGTLADLIYSPKCKAPAQSSDAIGQTLQRAQDIANGLWQIHSLNIAHRDIKPENILITQSRNGQLKIADFGLAKDVDFISGTGCGTLLYLAPEIFNKTATSDMRPADVYSFGLLLWELWHGRRVYMDCMSMNISEFKDYIVKGNRPQWNPGHGKLSQISEEWKRIASCCWNPVAKDRLTAAAVLDSLKQLSSTVRRRPAITT